jgi:hypothetical protein
MEENADLGLFIQFQIYLEKAVSSSLSPLFLTDGRTTQSVWYREQLMPFLAEFVVSGSYASYLSKFSDMLI